MKRLVAFELDGTLTSGKQPIDDVMAGKLRDLLAVVDVAMVSSGDWPLCDKQVVSRLPAGTDLARLWVMSAGGSLLHRADRKATAFVPEHGLADESAARTPLSAPVGGTGPKLSIASVGSTSADMAAEGTGRPLGLARLAARTGIPAEDTLVVSATAPADAKQVTALGSEADVITVRGPEDTNLVITVIVSWLKTASDRNSLRLASPARSVPDDETHERAS